MINVNEADIDRITEVFHLILKGKKPSAIKLPPDYPDNEIRQVVGYINRFVNEYNAATTVFYSLAKGESDIEPPKGNMALLSSFKSLQASLKNLTWITQQIAAGDFKQRINFMGDFSLAFNSMTEQLEISSRERERAHLDLQNRVEELAAARRAMLNIMEDLEESRKEAEAATKAKSDFLANMSHEIRTPMNAIIGLSHLVLKTELNPKQHDFISKIDKSAKSLLGIINDILDFSKIEAGKLNIDSINFDLNEVMHHLSNLVSIKAQEKGLELVFSLDPKISTELIGDPLRLGQVLLNLTNNAVKFTDQGEIVVNVELVDETHDDILIRFSVRDTGIGLTPEQTGKLFQSFQQADTSTTRNYGGTGLGLTISKQLSEMMGGSIGVDSVYGSGSTFYFTARLGKQKKTGKPRSIIPDYLDQLSVMVVDDNSTSLTVLEHYLLGYGFTVTTAGSGHEALTLLTKQNKTGEKPVDLILMDWQMPGMDGIETSKRILSDTSLDPMPKIIMATAYGREDVIQQTENIGLNGFLLKPVTESMLFDAVIEAFGEKGTSTKAFNLGNAEKFPKGFDAIRGARVFLVEDNAINQQVAVELLQDEGFFVDIAENGKEAIDRFSTPDSGNEYDIILMDLQMPVMGGIEATRKIRQWEKTNQLQAIPILAMTADAMTGVKEKVLDAGMNDYLSKPIDPQVLFNTLVTWIKPGKRPLHQAYLKKLNPSDKEPAREIHIPDLPGINTGMGLSRVNNKQMVYLEILGRFVEQFKDFGATMQQHLEDNDLKTAHRLAHTLKGIAGSIGAQALQTAAAAVEKALQENRLSTLQEHLAELQSQLEMVLTGLLQSNVLDVLSAEPPAARTGPVNLNTLNALLEELKNATAKSIPKASKQIIQQIKEHPLPNKHASVYADIEAMVKKYRFKQATTLIEELMDLQK